jgi:hypothetical protein
MHIAGQCAESSTVAMHGYKSSPTTGLDLVSVQQPAADAYSCMVGMIESFFLSLPTYLPTCSPACLQPALAGRNIPQVLINREPVGDFKFAQPGNHR